MLCTIKTFKLLKYGAKVDLPIGSFVNHDTRYSDIEEIYTAKCESNPAFKTLLHDEIEKIRAKKDSQQRARQERARRQQRRNHSHSNFGGTGNTSSSTNNNSYGISQNYNITCQKLVKEFTSASNNPVLESHREKIVQKKCSEKEFLGIESTEKSTVLKAYKKLARKIHPDRYQETNDKELAHALFCCLGAAKAYYTK